MYITIAEIKLSTSIFPSARGEAECGVSVLRYVALPGSEGDVVLNRLRAIRVLGLVAGFNVFEEIVLCESLPTLCGSAKALT